MNDEFKVDSYLVMFDLGRPNLAWRKTYQFKKKPNFKRIKKDIDSFWKKSSLYEEHGLLMAEHHVQRIIQDHGGMPTPYCGYFSVTRDNNGAVSIYGYENISKAQERWDWAGKKP